MKTELPSREALHAALIANGREANSRKRVLNSGWSMIDESGSTREQIMTPVNQATDTPALRQTKADESIIAELTTTAQSYGWSVSTGPEGTRIDLGLNRRAKAGVFFFEDRGPSLCVGILSEPVIANAGVYAFVLHLSTFLPRVRASLLDFGPGPRLVWEVLFDPTDNSGDTLNEALCCLAGAVRHGQAEAETMARDHTIATQWLAMNFPGTQKKQNQ